MPAVSGRVQRQEEGIVKPLLRDVAPRISRDRSQFGEGSIISEILRRIGITGGRACEFGAGDGEHLSNTAHLRDAGWAVDMIEADPDKAAEGVYIGVVDPITVNAWVDLTCSVVSIDVDGEDYAILCAMGARPAVLCIEHHPMIPAHVSLLGGADVGCSALALKEWADENDYLVVAMTHCNTIMVKAGYASAFDDVDIDFLHMFDPSGVTWVLSNVKTGDFGIHGPWPFGRAVELPWAMVDGLARG